MKQEEIKWCPQHGYPLPCYKCGYTGSGFDPSKIGEDMPKATKQDIIREGIAQLEYEEHNHYEVISWINAPSSVKDICYRRADKKLQLLHSQGLVIVVEGELPKNPYMMSATRKHYRQAQQDMLKAGCKLTIPLVEG